MCIYVDDILLVGNDEDGITSLKDFLDVTFRIKNLGYVKYYLGLEITRSDKGLFLCQRKYTLDLLSDAYLLDAKPLTIPLDPHARLNDNDGEPLLDPSQYRSIVGKRLYLTVYRPDISFSVQLLSQFMQFPRTPHLKVALRVLRYLKGTASQGLLFSSTSPLTLTCYCDSDWGTCSIQSDLSLATVCFLALP